MTNQNDKLRSLRRHIRMPNMSKVTGRILLPTGSWESPALLWALRAFYSTWWIITGVKYLNISCHLVAVLLDPAVWMQVMTHSASSAVTVNGGLHVMFNTVLQYWLTLLFCSACIDWCEGVAGLLSLTGLQISCLAFIQEATCSCQKEPTVFNFTAHSWIISVTQRLCLTHNCKLISCKPCETWMILSLEQAQMFLDLLAMFRNYWIC